MPIVGRSIASANHNSCMKARLFPGPCTTACVLARFEGHAPSMFPVQCLCHPLPMVAQPGGPLCADRGHPPDWRSLCMRPGHRPEPEQSRHVWGGQGTLGLPASAAHQQLPKSAVAFRHTQNCLSRLKRCRQRTVVLLEHIVPHGDLLLNNCVQLGSQQDLDFGFLCKAGETPPVDY
jgi:hypothetical protein